MTMYQLAGALGEVRVASAATGTALSTTAAFVQLPPGTAHVFIEARNYVTGVVAQVRLNPYLVVLRTQDNYVTFTDESEDSQDASAATDVTWSSQDTLANGDAFLIGAHLPFRGVSIDVDTANANAATLAVNYWNGTAWTDITPTDGTASAGATLAVDGTVTWTLPTDWVAATLLSAQSAATAAPFSKTPLYWTRWTVSAALDATTTLNSMLAMNRDTGGIALVSARVLEMAVFRGVGGVGCVEAVMDAGTGNLIVNVASQRERGFL